MLKLNAFELVNNLLASKEESQPEKNLFLSSFTLEGVNEIMEGKIRNIIIRPGFTLNITQIKVLKDVELASPFQDELVGFTFCLEGQSKFIIPVIKKSELTFKNGISTLYKTAPHTGYVQFTAGTYYTSIAIHLQSEKFQEIIGDTLILLEPDFAEAVKTLGAHKLHVFPFSGKIRVLLNSLLNDDFSGLSKQFFIESKVLEIIGLHIDALTNSIRIDSINSQDLEKIQQCEKILRAHFNQPLSLMQLAKDIGLNDFKLKQGFKQVYGKPVFKYLQEYRLNMAMESLKNSDKQVSEVAEEIGYNSLGSFSNAFFEQFGVRPVEIKSV